jgi:hypothetical protein
MDLRCLIGGSSPISLVIWLNWSHCCRIAMGSSKISWALVAFLTFTDRTLPQDTPIIATGGWQHGPPSGR